MVVLFVLIPLAWLAIVAFGLALVRLAARSDQALEIEMAEWVALNELAGQEHLQLPAERSAEEPSIRAYRASGSS